MPTMFFSSGMEHQMKAMLWSAKLLLLSCCCCCKTWPLGSHQHTVIATLSSASAGAADVAGPVCRHDLNSFLHHPECARSCGNCVSGEERGYCGQSREVMCSKPHAQPTL